MEKENTREKKRLEKLYTKELNKIKETLADIKYEEEIGNKVQEKYYKEYWAGYEKGITRIYKGSEGIADKIHIKLLNLLKGSQDPNTNERYKQLSLGYKAGLKYGEKNLLLSKKRGRPGIGKEKTKMVGSRITITQYEELKKRVKNCSKWIRELIDKELDKESLHKE